MDFAKHGEVDVPLFVDGVRSKLAARYAGLRVGDVSGGGGRLAGQNGEYGIVEQALTAASRVLTTITSLSPGLALNARGCDTLMMVSGVASWKYETFLGVAHPAIPAAHSMAAMPYVRRFMILVIV